ncbi:MAG: DUF5666 domain-containing protein [Woeseiaceae bacterium]|nr:DUF5666 domain-containing protein [Woeseiaceae bacterium]
MIKKTTRFATVTAFLVFALSACGGGGGGGDEGTIEPPDDPPVGGIGRNGVAIGPIANFGSIVVNGVTYNTDAATFTIDDEPGTQDDLDVGDVVVVSGTINDDGITGVADSVFFDDLVKGPVDSIDLATSSLVVLGQPVLVGASTSFDDGFSPAALEGVNVGQIVEVSGQIDADDNIVATRIEPKPTGTMFEVYGTVTGNDATAQTFNIRGLEVDYSGAMLEDFPSGQVADGDFVEVKGSSLGTSGELLATEVELKSLIPVAGEGDLVEIEGFITRFVSSTDFDVSGIPVTTTGATTYEGGSEADLGLNIKVEVEGSIDASGLITASKIDIRRAKAVRVTADIDSVDAANDSLVVLGISISVDELTRLEDKSSADIDPLNVSDLSAGEYVHVRGDEFPADSGDIRATILEREDTDTEAILQGFAETISAPSFSILGVTIETNGATVFRDENDVVISSTEFFDRLAANALVKAEGIESAATTISATEVEYELEL